MVPEFVAYGTDIIRLFILTAEEKHVDRSKRYKERVDVDPSPNKTLYSYTWKDFEPLSTQYYYEFEVKLYNIVGFLFNNFQFSV